MTELVQLETVIPGLHASEPAPLPFGESLQIRAFLLRREQGNILVYSAPTLAGEGEAIADRGGVSRQYLNHRHEAAFGDDGIKAPLITHANERDAVSRERRVAYTFLKRHTLDEDFEVVPTPGHTAGATAYLWNSGDHRVLFTGDTIYLNDGEWIAAMLGSSDRERYIESLELIRSLDFDVLVPWVATAGQPFHALTGRADAERRIDTILDRVRSGGSD